MRIVILAFILIVVLPTDTIRAEIVLDDFDDPASAISPEMENVLTSTPNVGELSAARRIGIGGVSTDPNGSIDSNISAVSRLTMSLTGHERTTTFTPQISLVFRYDFAEVDASENGSNDSILMEFDSISGTEGPLFIRSFIRDSSHPASIFESAVLIPLESGPITIAMPFSSFHYRASSQGSVDFERLTIIDFDVFFFGASEDAEWFAQLDRVSFGKSGVPEPSSLLGLFWSAGLVCYKQRRHAIGGTACGL